ncbi:uncharacterized endoplasmic reticulum membrane protein C16E8.02 isoform X1 [Momordica charantia]|uniref:Uncharacterized endoplasmic reticulum membrane protein C16E8.02 isoform X1 n=2 Tax=Momordica charantia TaxID=3673 RepID=A0A6J1C0I5_MOMCH|nr:uncharacterized endoplasmic reticulum membrane protein C16E8.02 isoform X1 [Momordica charantia]
MSFSATAKIPQFQPLPLNSRSNGNGNPLFFRSSSRFLGSTLGIRFPSLSSSTRRRRSSTVVAVADDVKDMDNNLKPSSNPNPGLSIFPEILMGKTGLFDLETQFAFYGAYHSNPINIFIHVLFVWPIFFTALMYLYFTPSLYSIPKTLCGFEHGLVLNFGFLFTLICAVSYVAFDKRAGSMAALLCLVCWGGAGFLANSLGYSLTWKVVLAAQLFCWTNQFIGHGVFEKRAPALLDNLAQAFLMAPFFVFLEVLQNLFRYEPYPGFNASVQAKIKEEIKEWKEKKEKLS